MEGVVLLTWGSTSCPRSGRGSLSGVLQKQDVTHIKARLTGAFNSNTLIIPKCCNRFYNSHQKRATHKVNKCCLFGQNDSDSRLGSRGTTHSFMVEGGGRGKTHAYSFKNWWPTYRGKHEYDAHRDPKQASHCFVCVSSNVISHFTARISIYNT